MAEQWVVNASPLISLARIEQIHLLTELADDLLVPAAVVDEVMAGPEDDPARLYLSHSPLPNAQVALVPSVQAWDLGSGESAVLSYAYHHPGWRAVVDDGAARKCAKALGIPVIGTLGIVLRAAVNHKILAAAPLLHQLHAAGFRLNHEVIRVALAETTGESWPE